MSSNDLTPKTFEQHARKYAAEQYWDGFFAGGMIMSMIVSLVFCGYILFSS